MIITIFVVYLVAHLFSYILFLRNIRRLQQEKGIFLFHFLSVIVWGLVSITLIGFTDGGLVLAVLILSLHGLYSISFLEMWSLAQGGYSLLVMREIIEAQSAQRPPNLSLLATAGEGKQQSRIAGLHKLGLVNAAPEVALTSRGKLVAYCLGALMSWTNPSQGASASK